MLARVTRARLDAALAAKREAQRGFLRSLVATPSDNPPGDCDAIAAVAASGLEALGFAVERHAVPEATVRAQGMLSVTNLVVRERFGDGPVVALNAHGDVVPPGEGWTHDPYGAEIVDGVMYGRGVAVSKSDFATYAFALEALRDAGLPLAGAVELHLTFDEEIGGLLGPKWLLDQGVVTPDLCISAGLAYGVVTAHNGCLHLQVALRGRSAHAAAPETGIDAIEAMQRVLAALYAERAGFPARPSPLPGIGHPNLTVGLISGGINTNVVPDRCTIRLDRRMTPEEDPATVEDALRRLIAAAAGGAVEVEVTRRLLAAPLVQLPGAEALIEPLRRHAADSLGVPVGVGGVPLYTDARLYAEAGVPTVSYGAGPRTFLEANGHRADERLRLADLEAATRAVALTLAELLAPAAGI